MDRKLINAFAKELQFSQGEKALEYCKKKIDRYEEQLKKPVSSFDDLDSNIGIKIMIEFYIAVSLMLQLKD